MKKIFKTAMFAVAVMAAGYGSIKTYDANQLENDDLLIQNVEAMCDPGDPQIAPGWYKGYTMADVWYHASSSASCGVTISYSEPSWWESIGVTWSSMRCCIHSVDANACNFTQEDANCVRYAVR